MNDTGPPLPPELLLAALLAAVPVVGLLVVRRARGEDRPPVSALRFLAMYLLLALALSLATLVDDVPMALGLLGALLGLFGLGIGVEPLYRFLYTNAWLDARPLAVRQDTARWERPALVLAAACLLAAVLMALGRTDIAEATGRGASLPML
jgi:membrane associated rhomboid family serine protease